MKIVGIETSTLVGGVALLDDETLVAEYTLNVALTHSERLLSVLDQLLAATGTGLAEVDGLAVAVGPGSFTGLRIGLSTAKGLAFATGKPLVGVPTLDALARTLPFARHPVCPILDAKKGEVYACLYRTDRGEVERLWEYVSLAPAELSRRLDGPVIFLGDGVAAYRELLERELGPAALFAPPGGRVPSAAAVAELGLRALRAGETADPAALTPLYVRPSEAELARARLRHAGSAH